MQGLRRLARKTDGCAHDEAGSMRRRLEPLRRQQLKMKDIQRQLEEDVHEIYELLRRNGTRCDCNNLFILIFVLKRCKV